MQGLCLFTDEDTEARGSLILWRRNDGNLIPKPAVRKQNSLPSPSSHRIKKDGAGGQQWSSALDALGHLLVL